MTDPGHIVWGGWDTAEWVREPCPESDCDAVLVGRTRYDLRRAIYDHMTEDHRAE